MVALSASLSANNAAFTDSVQAANGAFTTSVTAATFAATGAITAADLSTTGTILVDGAGNVGEGLQVGEQVLARSARLNDNPAGPDDGTTIPFMAVDDADVVTKAYLEGAAAAKADVAAAATTYLGSGKDQAALDAFMTALTNL